MIVGSNILAGASGQGGYFLNRSVRLRSSASAYFNRTFSAAGNSNTWTFSTFLKRGNFNTQSNIFNTATPIGTNGALGQFYFDNNNKLGFYQYTGVTTYTNIITTAVFRDPSSWYHIVLRYDDTQATAANRVRIYVNGVQITAFDTASYPTQNFNGFFNAATPHVIGLYAGNGGGNFFDGYLTEINFVGGQSLDPSSFGEFNTLTGVWQPKKYVGTYGTNGFYLNFNDNSAATAAAIGKDSSGNGNNWTPNNISVTAGVTYDSMTDVPTLTSPTTANYAVLNPLNQTTSGSAIPSNGNLTLSQATNNIQVTSTIGMSSGKWYYEHTITALGGENSVGIGPSSANAAAGTGAGQYGYYFNGNKYINGSVSSYGAAYTTGDIIGVAYDADTGSLTFYKNGASQGIATTGITGTMFALAATRLAGGQNSSNLNFGQRPFSYTPPTGFLALNTYNLPAPTIANGAEYMAASLYTGTGAALSVSNAVNGKTFQPDFVWLKGRSVAYNNYLYDSVRGALKELYSDSTSAEVTATQTMTSFNSGGFSVGTNSGVNQSAATFVGWQWKESASSGFDIVVQTLATTGINTINHNLNVVPKMVIAKKTNGVEQWLVYQSSVTTQSQYLGLNTTAAVATSANLWGSSAFTSSQIYFSGTSGNVYVFYIFAEIAGYSKFGSYTGNGSADGTFVYTGFRPRWILTKSSSAVSDWTIVDTSRSTYNLSTATLFPNVTAAEGSGFQIDVLSNGFKLRSTGQNTNAVTYIYAAFAENPFKNSLAR